MNEMNSYIHSIGYSIRVAEGIVNPSQSTLDTITARKLELKEALTRYKESDLEGFNNSLMVQTYSKYGELE